MSVMNAVAQTMNNIASAIAEQHITPHGAKLQLLTVCTETNKFLALVSHPDLHSYIEEFINVNNMKQHVAEEYMHCRVHGMAANLLAKLYPDKP